RSLRGLPRAGAHQQTTHTTTAARSVHAGHAPWTALTSARPTLRPRAPLSAAGEALGRRTWRVPLAQRDAPGGSGHEFVVRAASARLAGSLHGGGRACSPSRACAGGRVPFIEPSLRVSVQGRQR